MKIRIGTSGWSYDHWKGIFYPLKLPKTKWLTQLASIFDTVEINATFYRQPKPRTFEKWYAQTPDDFLFSIKASRFITHIKKLNDVQDSLNRFYQAIAPLKEKIGVILFQLPPSLHYNQKLLDHFLDQLDLSWRTTLEVRHASFIEETFYQSLSSRNIAFCWSDTAGRYPYSEEVTADFLYIRLHGSPFLYRSSYSENFLKTFGDKIRETGRDAFIYFDNDAEGHAPKNALWLKNYIEKI